MVHPVTRQVCICLCALLYAVLARADHQGVMRQQRTQDWHHADQLSHPAGSAGRQRQSGPSSADDRFGELDIITGKRVRDLRLEPVLQLAQWRQSLFGSWESTSESLDEDSPDGGRPR